MQKMKSQDILLLLKLVSLWQQQTGRPREQDDAWQDWQDQHNPRHFSPARLKKNGNSLITGESAAVLAAQEDRSADPLRDVTSAAFSPSQGRFALETPGGLYDLDPPNRHDDWMSAQFSVRALAEATGVSKSQVSLSLQRCHDVGLTTIDRLTGAPRANVKALGEFIVYAIRYVFPAKPGEITRGIATALAAPVLKGQIMTAGEFVPVWPDARGNTKGLAVEPLFKSVPQAVRKDAQLYALLALTDAIRVGQARERNYAADKLMTLLEVNHHE